MVMMSSTESKSPNVRFPWGRFPWGKIGSGEKREGMPEKKRQTSGEAAVEFFIKELDASLPPKLGSESTSTNKPKEEWQEEVFMRFDKFMKGGDCKVSFTAMKDCVEESQSIFIECNQHLRLLFKCIDAHSRYHQPVISATLYTVEHMAKNEDDLAERINLEEMAESLRGYSDHI